MTPEQTQSWIFLSVALGSQTAPTDLEGISMIADGINHAIPTQKEMQSSINWLIGKALIRKHGSKYDLTILGKSLFAQVSAKNRTTMKIWKDIEKEIKNYA
jgi:hypothetical protein